MRTFRIAAVFTAGLLGGCITDQSIARDVHSVFVGRIVAELMDKLGDPDGQTREGDGMRYVWVKQAMVSALSPAGLNATPFGSGNGISAVTTRQREDHNQPCTLTVIADRPGLVTSAIAEGNPMACTRFLEAMR